MKHAAFLLVLVVAIIPSCDTRQDEAKRLYWKRAVEQQRLAEEIRPIYEAVQAELQKDADPSEETLRRLSDELAQVQADADQITNQVIKVHFGDAKVAVLVAIATKRFNDGDTLSATMRVREALAVEASPSALASAHELEQRITGTEAQKLTEGQEALAEEAREAAEAEQKRQDESQRAAHAEAMRRDVVKAYMELVQYKKLQPEIVSQRRLDLLRTVAADTAAMNAIVASVRQPYRNGQVAVTQTVEAILSQIGDPKYQLYMSAQQRIASNNRDAYTCQSQADAFRSLFVPYTSISVFDVANYYRLRNGAAAGLDTGPSAGVGAAVGQASAVSPMVGDPVADAVALPDYGYMVGVIGVIGANRLNGTQLGNAGAKDFALGKCMRKDYLEVLQIIDDNNFLAAVHCHDGSLPSDDAESTMDAPVWVSGFCTKGFSAGKKNVLQGEMIAVVGTKDYEGSGGTKTVLLIKPFDIKRYLASATPTNAAKTERATGQTDHAQSAKATPTPKPVDPLSEWRVAVPPQTQPASQGQ